MVHQEVTPADIERLAAGLWEDRRGLIACGQPDIQKRAVSALARMATRWRDPEYHVRRKAERENAGFPFSMIWQSLNPLLDSFSEEALWKLIESESARDIQGAVLIGHVIAANTPLLAWTSVARALLVQSASLVKLPSHPIAAWAEYFHASLREADNDLANLVCLCRWKGGEEALDEALCRSCDLIVAYGSDETIFALEKLCRPGSLLDYGHRLSFGIVTTGADWNAAARGFAKDTLLYDQGGCLSPHCLFVEGDAQNAASFAGLLAQALAEACRDGEFVDQGLCEDRQRSATVREERALAQMESGTCLWTDMDLLWTVIAVSNTGFRASRTHGIVYVIPFLGRYLNDALAGVRARMQGVGIASANDIEWEEWQTRLKDFGVNYFCFPGKMQCPGLAWRQNGKDVLDSLVGRGQTIGYKKEEKTS